MQTIKIDYLEHLPRSYYQQLSLLLRRLSLMYLAYFVCRLLFFVYNRQQFEQVTWLSFAWDSVAGLRFDTFSIMVANSLFILLSALPFAFFWKSFYQKILYYLFMITNTVFVAFNLIDVAYFAFIKKRSTSEIFDQFGGQTDLKQLIPQFAGDYWWLILLLIALVWLLSFLYKQVRIHSTQKELKSYAFLNWLIFILVLGLATLGIRGGTQRVPIDVVNAGSMTAPEEAPLVLNTPFTIIKSVNQAALQELHYFSSAELKQRYYPIHQFHNLPQKKDNVVVLILESFSKEYTKLGKTTSVTPFFDSLMDHSLVFTNGISNGTKSIEGIPAILSSLPSLMANPFINSIYANNEQSSLARLLGKEGYSTAFFHGGINGTMNFDDWAAAAAYQNYYGKNEYDQKGDFDGFWGILDEPFLQFSIRKMNELKTPFHSAIFTLSSHHPYYVPEKYKNKFKKTALENSESIGYADYSLKQFFETAKKQAWYQNTLFVLVADHTSISEHPFYSRIGGVAAIPIVFFKPDNSLKGTNTAAFSQIDILPSVLRYLGYPKSFFAFGDAFQEQQKGNDYLFVNGNSYQYSDSTVYLYSGDKAREAYNYKRDSSLTDQLLGRYPQTDEYQLKAYQSFLQTYHHALIYNQTNTSFQLNE